MAVSVAVAAAMQQQPDDDEKADALEKQGRKERK